MPNMAPNFQAFRQRLNVNMAIWPPHPSDCNCQAKVLGRPSLLSLPNVPAQCCALECIISKIVTTLMGKGNSNFTAEDSEPQRIYDLPMATQQEISTAKLQRYWKG